MANIQAEERSTSSLIANVIGDVQTLLRDELHLAKTEVTQEFAKGKRNLVQNSVALFFACYGAVLLGVSLSYLLVEFGLPWWASYGLLAILFGGGGIAALALLSRNQKRMNVIPRQTIANVKETVSDVKENVKWIRKAN